MRPWTLIVAAGALLLGLAACSQPSSRKEEDEVLRPEELLKKYHEQRAALDSKIDKQLCEIENLLGIKIR